MIWSSCHAWRFAAERHRNQMVMLDKPKGAPPGKGAPLAGASSVGGQGLLNAPNRSGDGASVVIAGARRVWNSLQCASLRQWSGK